jgi:hypothetical protein
MHLPSASVPNVHAMSGALGADPVDAMLGPPPMRAQDMDLAVKLERKLQEVQRKLERQGSGSGSGSGRSGDSGSSYSLGEIERGISSSPIRRMENVVKEVGGQSFAVERGVVVLR